MERRGAEGGGAVGAEEKRGAKCDPAAAEELLKREGVVPKTNGGEEVEEMAGVVEAAGAVEKREPGEVTESMAAALLGGLAPGASQGGYGSAVAAGRWRRRTGRSRCRP